MSENVTISKYVSFNQTQWKAIEAYSAASHFSSAREAIRVLASRGLRCLRDQEPQGIHDGLAHQKRLLFSPKQWQEIEDYHYSKRTASPAHAVRVLVANGLIVEKEWFDF